MCAVEDLLEWFDEEETLLGSCEPISCEPQRLQKQLAEQKVYITLVNKGNMQYESFSWIYASCHRF